MKKVTNETIKNLDEKITGLDFAKKSFPRNDKILPWDCVNEYLGGLIEGRISLILSDSKYRRNLMGQFLDNMEKKNTKALVLGEFNQWSNKPSEFHSCLDVEQWYSLKDMLQYESFDAILVRDVCKFNKRVIRKLFHRISIDYNIPIIIFSDEDELPIELKFQSFTSLVVSFDYIEIVKERNKDLAIFKTTAKDPKVYGIIRNM